MDSEALCIALNFFDMTLIKLLRVALQIGPLSNWNHTSNPSQQSALQGCRAQQRSELPLLLHWLCWFKFLHVSTCTADIWCLCTLSFLLARFDDFHSNAHHLMILPNVWSYLSICFQYCIQFPVLAFPSLFQIFLELTCAPLTSAFQPCLSLTCLASVV